MTTTMIHPGPRFVRLPVPGDGRSHAVCGPYHRPGTDGACRELYVGIECKGARLASHLFLTRDEARQLARAIVLCLDEAGPAASGDDELQAILSPRITDAQPGTPWDGMTIQRVLHRPTRDGGTAILEAARHDTGESVILKCVAPGANREAGRLRREYSLMASLPAHPHVLRPLGWHADDRGAAMALEPCDETLVEYVNRRCRMPAHEPEVAQIFAQFVSALAHCYAHGVAHRDVKLDNVMLLHGRGPGQMPACKLSDFGYAERYEPGERRWPRCGTIWYMAGEVMRGESHDAELADVWSAGAVLYGMIEGKLPYLQPSRWSEHATREEERAMTDAVTTRPFLPTVCASHSAFELISALLQRCPARRPRFRDILKHPWLASAVARQPHLAVVADPPPLLSAAVMDAPLADVSMGDTPNPDSVPSFTEDVPAAWWGLRERNCPMM
jgi:serine/threonine protein kinase